VSAKKRNEIEEIFRIVEAHLEVFEKAADNVSTIEKRKAYLGRGLDLEGIRALHNRSAEILGGITTSEEFFVENGSEEWTFTSFGAFAAQYANARSFSYWNQGSNFRAHVSFALGRLSVSVKAVSIERVHAVFATVETYLRPVEPEYRAEPTQIRIFIGHGRNSQWRDLKDHLQDKHGYDVEAYEIGARAGHTIRDILEEMLAKSTIAFLVLTAEDEGPSGEFRARQNVVHETGLFKANWGSAEQSSCSSQVSRSFQIFTVFGTLRLTEIIFALRSAIFSRFCGGNSGQQKTKGTNARDAEPSAALRTKSLAGHVGAY
jgi:hypothetical protein